MSTLTPKPNGNVIDYYSGSVVTTITKSSGNWIGLSITNDDIIDLTFTVNGLTITVKVNEVFDDNFVDFNTISINTNTSYRLALRG